MNKTCYRMTFAEGTFLMDQLAVAAMKTLDEVDAFILRKQEEGIEIILDIVLAPTGAMALLDEDERSVWVFGSPERWNMESGRNGFRRADHERVNFDFIRFLSDVEVRVKLLSESPLKCSHRENTAFRRHTDGVIAHRAPRSVDQFYIIFKENHLMKSMKEVDAFLQEEQAAGRLATVKVTLAPVGGLYVFSDEERTFLIKGHPRLWRDGRKTAERASDWTLVDFDGCDLATIEVEAVEIDKG